MTHSFRLVAIMFPVKIRHFVIVQKVSLANNKLSFAVAKQYARSATGLKGFSFPHCSAAVCTKALKINTTIGTLMEVL